MKTRQNYKIWKDFGVWFVGPHAQYGSNEVKTLVPATEGIADSIKGDLPKNAFVYVGTGSKHYYTSKDLDELSDEHLEVLDKKGVTLADNVDGGWVKWEGRPEFSDTYADFRDAELVEPEELLKSR